MTDKKTMHVVMQWRFGSGEPNSMFLNPDSARQHAEEMEKIEEGSFHVEEVEVKDWPADI